MEEDKTSCASVVDMSNLDDIENMFQKLVSRHSKFTKEFENNLEICSSQLNKLKANNTNKTISLLNSLFNVDVTPAKLKKMQENYELCPLCKTVEHAPFNHQGRTQDAKSSNYLSDDYLQYLKPSKSLTSTKFFFDFRSKPNQVRKSEVLKKEASSTFHDRRISDYIVFLINDKQLVDSGSFSKFSLQTFKTLSSRLIDFFINFFPLFNITSFSNLIIVVQWFLYILRVLIFRNFIQKIDIEEESIKFGAFSGKLFCDDLDVYRALTSTFFHNSFAHLIISMMMHLRFSSVFERINGIIATVFVYLASSAYGMIGVCWLMPNTLQANGFAGDWGVAGALLSRFFLFPYLVHREYQNITNVIVSYICLFFLKTIGRGSSILVSAHLLSAISGLCMGTMINIRSKTNKISGVNKLLVDFICSCVLLLVPIFSIFMLFTLKGRK